MGNGYFTAETYTITSIGIIKPPRRRYWMGIKEIYRVPRVQLFDWDVPKLAKYFADQEPYVITNDMIDFTVISDPKFQISTAFKAPTLVISMKEFIQQADLIFEHRWLLGHVMIAECTEADAKNPLVQKLQSK
jgi:hypothetical protein